MTFHLEQGLELCDQAHEPNISNLNGASPVGSPSAPQSAESPRASTPTPTAIAAPFVSMVHGALLGSMQANMILDDPTAFMQMMTKPIPLIELPTNSTRRRPRKKTVATATSRRSTRLAKKAAHRTPVVVTAQNLLMRKLGLIFFGTQARQPLALR
jgi:hypothetical protein